MADKLGTYITKLMTTIIDKNQDQFVKDLAYTELSRLKVDINEFLRSQKKNDEEEENKEKPCCKAKKEKQLLQEEKENGK